MHSKSRSSCLDPRHANQSGAPVWRPVWYEFPDQDAFYATETEGLLGPALLSRPVLEQGAASVRVDLPAGVPWFDYWTGRVVDGGASFDLPVTMDSVPLYLRGGSIVPRRDRARRSTQQMHGDPVTLVVSLDGQGRAEGDLYMDDGRSFAFMVSDWWIGAVSLVLPLTPAAS